MRGYKKKLKWAIVLIIHKKSRESERVCANKAQTACETFPSATRPVTPSRRKSISRYTSCLSFHFLLELHQWAGLALSGHHDSNRSHARQSRGADLWGHGKRRRRRHLRLSLLSPVGDGDYRAPEKLWGGPVCTGRPLVFTWRCASHVVTREPL